MTSSPKKIAFVGDYVPRRCGIATFTYDLRNAVAEQDPEADCFVCSVSDTPEGYDYPPEVRFEIAENDLQSYEQAAEFINLSKTGLVCIQHEYGIYGGPAGSNILALARAVQAPVVTTLHTILREPTADQRRVLEKLAAVSTTLVVMTQRGRSMLQEIYGIKEERVTVIPHGIPDMPFIDPNFFKDQFGVEGKKVILTFGLLSPDKGIEEMITALPEVAERVPDVVYVVLGATHPNLLRKQGESYRMSLERLAEQLGVKDRVIFFNRFVEPEELKEFLGAADVYVTPYHNEAQITSGPLAYAFGCGKAVVSTPYWHAAEMLAEERGVLVPFRDSSALAKAVSELLADEVRRHAYRKRAYLLGREMTWSQVAHQYLAMFRSAREARAALAAPAAPVKTLAQAGRRLPELRLEHLKRLSDYTGVIQHAAYTVPDFSHGYCTDDAARAFMLAVLLEELNHPDTELAGLRSTYAAFLTYAYIPETGTFHNFMSFDRRWLDKRGSEDSNGRVLWALGTAVGRTQDAGLLSWAAELLAVALPRAIETSSPRAWAFTLSGLYEYTRRFPGDRAARQVAEALAAKLLKLYRAAAKPDWPWFEQTLSYANARLPAAALLAGRMLENQELLQIGLRALEWLCRIQKSEAGCFRAVGNNGFFARNGTAAIYDQQPIEAYSTVSAALVAYLVTQEPRWHEEAQIAFDWFLGRNDLGLPLYDPQYAGCYDGLQIDRVNRNMGAESILSFLLALAELKMMRQTLAAYDTAVESEPNTLATAPK